VKFFAEQAVTPGGTVSITVGSGGGGGGKSSSDVTRAGSKGADGIVIIYY
jgi:hypothetical protein